MDKLKIALVILNYKGLSNTIDCLDSVEKAHLGEINLKVIVVDNGSRDGSAAVLEKIKGIHLIKNEENLGFSGGMNTGINYARNQGSDFIILLNNDTLVDVNFFKNILNTIEDSDIAAPKIYFAPGFEFYKDRYKKSDQGRVIWYAGGKIDWANVIGTHIGVNQVDHGQFAKKTAIDLATGCCMIISKKAVDKIGLLDEKYFLYLEDMDYCVSAKRAGLKINFLPQALIWHKNASSAGGSGSSLQDYYITRNRLIFAFKYAPIRTKFAVLRQVSGQVKNPDRRQALMDFLTLKYGKRN